MTLLMHRTAEPETCCICQRRSAGIGIYMPKVKDQPWTCDSPKCIQIAKVASAMNTKKLDQIERAALDAVARSSASTMLQIIMGELWERGVRSLEDATPEQIDLALDGIAVSGALADELVRAMVGFRDEVRTRVLRGDPPF